MSYPSHNDFNGDESRFLLKPQSPSKVLALKDVKMLRKKVVNSA